jgi:hypothetical protein
LDSVLLDPLPCRFFGSLCPSPIVFLLPFWLRHMKLWGGVDSRRYPKYSRYYPFHTSAASSLKKKGKSLSLHTLIAHHFRHAVTHFSTFSLHTQFSLSQSTHTKHYVTILSLLYLHPDLILLLHLPFEGTNFPHLVTLHLDLVQTKSKYLYFIVLMDLSYLTYSATNFCSPYS